MKFTILAASLAALGAASAASAQTAEANWTGGYVGGHVGYGWGAGGSDETVRFDTNRDGGFGDTVNTAAGANAFSPGFCDGRANGPTAAAGCRDDKNGVAYGVHAGYDWQAPGSALVLGVVGDVGTSKVRDAVTAFSTTPAFYTLERKVKVEGSLRARAGYAVGRSLIYATGGPSYAKVRNRFTTSNTANAFSASGDENAWGYKVGGGVEHKLTDSVSVGVQYLYASLKTDEARVRAGNSGTTPATNPFLLVSSGGTDFRRSETHFAQHSVQATVSFRF